MTKAQFGLMLLGAVGVASLAAHSAAAAGANANLGVWQSQSVAGNTLPATLGQSADTFTGVWLGTSAEAISQQTAAQLAEGTPSMAAQSQAVTSGAALTWEDNQWPAWTTAASIGSTDQSNSMWSYTATDLQQTATNDQTTIVDAQSSVATGEASQRQQGAFGDLHQQQRTQGDTAAAGYSVPPFPSQFTFDFAGVVRQFIGLTVENIVSF